MTRMEKKQRRRETLRLLGYIAFSLILLVFLAEVTA